MNIFIENILKNSTNLQTLVVFIVGFFVFILYRVQLENDLKSSATIILNEIREYDNNLQKLKNASRIDFYFIDEFSNMENWDSLKHKFIPHLSYDEYNALSIYYANIKILENERQLLKNLIASILDEKSRIFQRVYYDCASLNLSPEDYLSECNRRINLIEIKNQREFEPIIARRRFESTLINTNSILATTACKKLEMISNQKKYKLF